MFILVNETFAFVDMKKYLWGFSSLEVERFQGIGCFLSKAADANGASLAELNVAKKLHSNHSTAGVAVQKS